MDQLLYKYSSVRHCCIVHVAGVYTVEGGSIKLVGEENQVGNRRREGEGKREWKRE